ncbi:MAG: HYR domain-containing protein, partial [Saprospiraceae bacterium]
MNRHFYKLVYAALFFVCTVNLSAQNDTVYLSFVTTKIQCGETKAIKMQVKNFNSIVTLNFTMAYDQSKLRLVNFNGANVGAQVIASQITARDISGGQTFSWFRPNSPITVPDGDFFNFNFEPVSGSGGTSGQIEFTSMPTAIKVEAFVSGGGKKKLPVKVQKALYTIEDTYKPTITCPASRYIVVPSNTNAVDVNGLNPSFKDSLCGKASLSYQLTGATTGSGIDQDATGLSFKLGTTNVLYTVRDNANNTAECLFQIIVSQNNTVTLYNSAPKVLCSDSLITVETRVANFKEITALDFDLIFDKNVLQFQSKNQLNPNIKDGPTFVSETQANLGLIKVSFTDVLGVTLPDNSLLFSLTFKKIGNSQNTLMNYNNVEITTVSSNGNIVPFNVISVPINLIDTEAPKLTCPKDTVVYTTQLMQNNVQMFNIQASATDNCGIQPINYGLSGATVLNNTFNINGKFFNVGITNVSVNVQDYALNTRTCNYKVTVLQPQVINTRRTLDCQASEVTMDLFVKDFRDIRKMNTLLTWNPDSLELLSVSYNSPWISGQNVLSVTGTSSLSINFSSAQGITIFDNQIVAKVTYKIKVNKINDVYRIDTNVSNIEVGTNNSPVYGVGYDGFVRIFDTEGPTVINCPGNQIKRQDKCNAEVTWTIPTATDLCSKTVTIETNAPANATANIFANFKPTVFYYNFRDDAGNSTRCEFEVSVLDTIKPIISNCVTSDLILTTSSNSIDCGAALPANLLFPDVNENCTFTRFTNFKTGDIVPVGTSKYIITIRDNSNNEVTCERNINVLDLTAPKINLNLITNTPPIKLVDAELGKCGAAVFWNPATASDNCDVVSTVTSDIPSGAFFNLGRTKVTFTAKDNAGNISVDSLIVLVIDKEIPKFTNCPNSTKDTVLYLAPNKCEAQFDTPVILYTDNCKLGTLIASVSGVPNATLYPVGRTVLQFTAQDPTAICFYGVTVVDTIKPIIACPADRTLNTGIASCSAILQNLPPPVLLSDNCPLNLTTEANTKQTIFTRDTTIVTYTAIDGSQNRATCSFKIFVVDKTPPTLNCPNADITLLAELDKSTAIAAWTTPTATDFCDLSVDIKSTHENGVSRFPIGTSTVVYTATDKSKNTSTCSFKVTVIDNQNPKFNNCPTNNLSIATASNDCLARFSVLNTISATDNHKITFRDSVGAIASGIYPKGVYNINYTVRDSSGLSATCSFTIEVKDRTAPKRTFCPDPLSVTAVSGSCEVQLNINQLSFPTFTDNCDQLLLLDTLRFENNSWKKGLPANLTFRAGENRLAVAARDLSGNTDTCFFLIKVTGNVVPILPVNCGKKDTTLVAIGCSTPYFYDDPIAIYSICAGKESESYNIPSGFGFPIGTRTVVYTAKDKNGNTASCAFNVTVTDKIAPTITFIKDTVVAISSSCAAKVIWDTPIVKDLPCDTFKLAPTPDIIWQSGGIFPVGITTVKYQATDIYGNSSIKTMYVRVKDNKAPEFTKCPKNVEVNADGTVISDPDNVLNSGIIPNIKCDSISLSFKSSAFSATDNCDNVGPALKFNIPPTLIRRYGVGEQVINVSATDLSGNSATCSFTIKVLPFAPKPNPTVSDNTPCTGDAVTLKVDSIAGVNAVWYSTNNFTSKQSTTIVKNLSANSTGKYFVYYQKGTCTSKVDSVSFNVLNPPIVRGDTIKLKTGNTKTDNITLNDGLTQGLGYTISWQNANSQLGT